MNDEILYEDLTLQIGFKASFKGLIGTVQLFFGNHSPSDLHSLGVSYLTDEVLGLTHSQLPNMITARQQLCQVSRYDSSII